MANCPRCGTNNLVGAAFCQSCGAKLSQTYRSWEIWEHKEPAPSGRLVMAGALAFLAGILAVANGLLCLAGVQTWGDPLQSALSLCGAIRLFLGVMSIAGGILAINQTSWKLSFVGCFLGMLGSGLAFGALMGGTAMVLVAISKDEFSNKLGILS